MNRKLFRSIVLLITYAILLVVLLFRFEAVLGTIGSVISALSPLWIGFAIAFILNRPARFINKKLSDLLPEKLEKFATPISVTLTYLLLIILLVALVSIVVPELAKSIQTLIDNMPQYGQNLQDAYNRFEERFNLTVLGDFDLSALQGSLQDILSRALSAVSDTLPHLFTLTRNLFSAALTTLLALIFSVYMLADSENLKAQTRRLVITYVPEKYSEHILRVARMSSDTFGNFVRGQVVEAFILGILCFIGMMIFGFEYAPLISTLVGVTALVPIAGAYIGGAISFLLLLMISPIRALWFLVFLIILQQLESMFVYPRVVGSSVGLPGIWVMAAVTVGGAIFGFVGMLIGVPVSAVLYALLRSDLREKYSPQEEAQQLEALDK